MQTTPDMPDARRLALAVQAIECVMVATQDPSVSHRALGALVRLFDEDSQHLTVSALAAKGPDSEPATLAALRELEGAGYARLERGTDESGTQATAYVVHRSVADE